MYRDSGTGNLTIDLTGPEGNAFCLLGYANRYAKELGIDPKTVTKHMMAGDYNHLVKVFKETFPLFDLIGDPNGD